jgi:hypothetical protein
MTLTSLLAACAQHHQYIAAALEHADRAITSGQELDNNALAEPPRWYFVTRGLRNGRTETVACRTSYVCWKQGSIWHAMGALKTMSKPSKRPTSCVKSSMP